MIRWSTARSGEVSTRETSRRVGPWCTAGGHCCVQVELTIDKREWTGHGEYQVATKIRSLALRQNSKYYSQSHQGRRTT